MTTRIFPNFRPRRRMLTRKLAIELWVVSLASAILLAIALALNGAGDSGAAVERGRVAQPASLELKDFMERAALKSAAVPVAAAPATDLSPSGGLATAPRNVPALSRAAVAPRAAQPKAQAARVASAIPPLPRPAYAASGPAQEKAQAPALRTAMLDDGPWRLVQDTGASAVAHLVFVGNSLTSLAKKLPL